MLYTSFDIYIVLITTVLLSQPSQEVFQLFDTMVLLSKGCVIFSGNASEVLTYFKNLSAFKFDKTLSLYVNPADFLTDVSACVLRNADVR